MFRVLHRRGRIRREAGDGYDPLDPFLDFPRPPWEDDLDLAPDYLGQPKDPDPGSSGS